jgi:hypothetical protein
MGYAKMTLEALGFERLHLGKLGVLMEASKWIIGVDLTSWSSCELWNCQVAWKVMLFQSNSCCGNVRDFDGFVTIRQDRQNESCSLLDLSCIS